MMDGEKIKHPAFGMVQFNRVNGNADLYGSAVRHQHYMSLVIRRGYYKHDLAQDWYFGDKELIEVFLTASQFVELLTQMNMGSGVPCTIHHIAGEGQGAIPKQESEGVRIDRYMKDKMVEFAATLDGARAKAEEIINKEGPINKGDRNQLSNLMSQVFQELKSNIPFYEKSFTEATEKQIQKAKTEVENFINMKVQQTGLDALRAQANQALPPKGFTAGTDIYLGDPHAPLPGVGRPYQAGDLCVDGMTTEWRPMTQEEAAKENAFLGWVVGASGSWERRVEMKLPGDDDE